MDERPREHDDRRGARLRRRDDPGDWLSALKFYTSPNHWSVLNPIDEFREERLDYFFNYYPDPSPYDYGPGVALSSIVDASVAELMTNPGVFVSDNWSQWQMPGLQEVRRVAIILTDGPTAPYDMAATQAAIDNGMRVYFAGVGPNVDGPALQAAAEPTGGRYFHLDSLNQMGALYAEIAGAIGDPGADSDGDGLTDCIEGQGALVAPGFYELGSQILGGSRYVQTDPHNADSDGDGLSDSVELGSPLNLKDDPEIAAEYSFLVNKGITRLWNPRSDPNKADTDGEGLTDADEYELETNPRRQDTDGDRVNDYVEVQLGLNPLAPDDFQVAGSGSDPADLPAGTLLMPDNNTTTYLGHIVTWNHVSHLCDYECLEIDDWAVEQYNHAAGQLPDFPQGVYCYFNDCFPEDFERSFVLQTIDDQKIYRHDGTLLTGFVTELLTAACWEVKAVPSSDCVNDQIISKAQNVNYHSQIDEWEILSILDSLPGGQRPQLTQAQQAARNRMQQLAQQAATASPRRPDTTAVGSASAPGLRAAGAG